MLILCERFCLVVVFLLLLCMLAESELKAVTESNPFHQAFKPSAGDNKGLKVLVVVVDNRHLSDSIDGSKGFGSLVAVLQHNYCKHHNYDYVRIVNDKTDLHQQSVTKYPTITEQLFQKDTLNSIGDPKHGYDVLHPGYLRTRSSSWGKLPALWHVAETLGHKYDYIWFMDSDATPNPMQKDLSLGDALVKWDAKPSETVKWGNGKPSNASFLFMSNFPYRDDLPCAGTIIFKPSQFARNALREWWDFDLVYKARDDFMEQDALWYIIEAAPRYKYMINADTTVLLTEQQFSSAWRGYSDIWFAHIPSGEEYRAGYFRTM
jgi:hypothetical protein